MAKEQAARAGSQPTACAGILDREGPRRLAALTSINVVDMSRAARMAARPLHGVTVSLGPAGPH